MNAISLTVKPACGLPGEFSLTMDSTSLLRLLRRETELPSSVLEKFAADLFSPKGARLLGVDIPDQTLTEIGYFVD